MGQIDKIKILYTIPNFDTAGSGKVVYDLVKGIDKNKFEPEIACSSNKGSFFKEVEKLGVPIHIVATTTIYRPYSSLFSRLRPIVRFLKINNFDIVHSWHWSSDWTEALSARLAGVKWIYTKKAMSWGNRHWKIRSLLANFIITINDEMKGYFQKKRNQKLIALGIDTEYYNPIHYSGTIGKGDNFDIITVANLVPVKGIEVLIKAIHTLRDKNIKLTILGDSNNKYGSYLQSLCKELEVGGQVHFLGKKADVRPYIVGSNLYVIPTLNEGRKEGMPMALVEAMGMGIPVLGSDISGVNFVLKDFPELLFEAGNEQALAKAIKKIKVLDSMEMVNLGSQLREYVVKNFGYAKFIQSHEELYKRIVIKKQL